MGSGNIKQKEDKEKTYVNSKQKEDKDKTYEEIEDPENANSLSISIIKEDNIPGYDKSLSKSEIENDNIRIQMEKSICLIDGLLKGTGFLCLIQNQNLLLRVLITCNHVLNYLKIGNEIKLVFDEGKEKKLILDESRRLYTNDETDIAMLELKENEFDLNDYLKIDDDIYKFDEFNNIYKDKVIYIIHYEKGKELKYSAGPIKNIDNNNIFHCCSTEYGSSGAPILNLISFKVIGIHNGYEKRLCCNIGKLIKSPIYDYIKKEENKINIINSDKKLHLDNIDYIIDKLLSVIGKKPGKAVDLKEVEIKYVIDRSFPLIKNEKVLLELKAPLRVCGDINGQYYDLLRIFGHAGYPGEYNYLFLGNYVDFGKQSLEVICLLLCYKIKYPEKIYLLRGNHESAASNRIYGFYDECKIRYNVRIWKSFIDLFNWLPIAAIIDEKILCIHGGLSPYLKNLNNINDISRPTEIPDSGLLCDLLNSDPDKDVDEYDGNDKGFSVLFGEKIVQDFNKKNNISLIVRGNQMVNDGYEFFAQRQLVIIFSALNFKGEFDNSAGILIIDENLTCSFKVLRSVEN